MKRINEALYRDYVYEPTTVQWTDKESVRRRLNAVPLKNAGRIKEGGFPVFIEKSNVYVDTSDSHVAIVAPSGFKKSICFFMPAINTIAQSNENMVILDPKGELYSRTASKLAADGYKILVLNFRDMNADAYNPLRYPAMLWREYGEYDLALQYTSDFINLVSKNKEDAKNVDPFWDDTARTGHNGVIPIMYSSFPRIEDINLVNLSDFFTDQTAAILKRYIFETKINTACVTNLRSVLSEPDKTLMSTLAVAASYISPFIQNDKLARMVCNSTFELDELLEEKTVLYIITDDTTSVCDPIVSTLISQIKCVAVNKAFHSENGKLKTRLNFILDECCSIKLDGLEESLATLRGRNIRFYLCIQTLDGLKKLYPNYNTLLVNCSTMMFLGSTEPELLNLVSERCGKTNISANGAERYLISPAELQTLEKAWDYKEALYLNLSENIRFCTKLPAIEQYEDFCKYGKATLPVKEHPGFSFYTFKELLHDVAEKKAYVPYTRLKHTA